MGVCDLPIISGVCNVAGEAAGALVSAPFEWLANAMASTAAWLFEHVWAVFDTTTMVDVTNPEYTKVYALIFGVAIMVMLIFFCFQLITALARRESGALTHALTGLGKSVLGSFVVLTLTGLLLQATDQICVGIVQATGQTMQDMSTRIGLLAAGLTTVSITIPGVGAIITIFLAGLAICGALIVWFSLLIRKALLLVAIVFGPFALAGATWQATKGWFGKWAAFVVALILSKLVLVVILLVAVAQTASPIGPDLASISEPVAGVVLMLVAAFAPYMTYKFITFMGFDMYHAMSAEQEAKSAMNRPVPTRPQLGSAQKVLGGNSPSGSSGGGSGSSAPPMPTPPSPSSAGSSGGAPGAAGGGSGAGAAGASGAGGRAAAGGAAAAGPVGAGVALGAQAVQATATAGPKAGAATGGAAATQAEGAAPPNSSQGADARPTSPPSTSPPSPPPSAPSAPSAPSPAPPASASAAPSAPVPTPTPPPDQGPTTGPVRTKPTPPPSTGA
jgi:hypothetical protein